MKRLFLGIKKRKLPQNLHTYTLKHLNTKKAVTIIELIMVIMIVGILTTVSSMYIKETIKLWQFLNSRNEDIAQERISLLRMTRDIRQLKNSTSVNIATSTRFQFVDMNSNTIDYQLSGSNLMRNSDAIAIGITGLSFTYYNSSNATITTPTVAPSATDIYRIQIQLTAQSGTQSKTLKTKVYPRNL